MAAIAGLYSFGDRGNAASSHDGHAPGGHTSFSRLLFKKGRIGAQLSGGPVTTWWGVGAGSSGGNGETELNTDLGDPELESRLEKEK